MIDLDITFQPKQLLVAQLFSQTGPRAPTWIGYGGAYGSGKSRCIRDIILSRRYEPYRGTKGVIVRRVYKDLKDNHIDPFFAEHPGLRPFYNASDKELVLPHSNGSRIGFMFAETRADIDRQFDGPEFFDIFVDQAEQFDEYELQKMQGRNRWPGYGPGECKYGLFFNPGGIGMEFLHRVFYKREFRNKETPSDYAFTQAYGWDNYQWFTHLMDEPEFYALEDAARFELFITQTQYGRSLDGLPKAIRAGRLLGSFESFANQYFAGAWDSELCVLTAAEIGAIVKPWWTRWMAQDWGFGDHAAHGWFVTGKLSPSEWMKHFGGETEYPMDIVILYREHVISDRPEADMANDVVSMTPVDERPLIRDLFFSGDGLGQKPRQAGANSVGEAWSNIMRRHGMPSPMPADQARIEGWRFMYNCLRQANLRGQVFDEERSKQGPALFISTECPEAITRIPMAVRDEDDPEDVARVAGVVWEDVCDMIRYGLKSKLNPKIKAPREVRAQEVYDTYQDPNARAMAMRQFNARENRNVSRRMRPR